MVNSSLYNRLYNNNRLVGGAKKTNNIFKLLKEKQGLLLLVFANLIVQLGITYYIFLKSDMDKYKKYKWLIVIGLFILIFVIGLFPMPSWLKFILFCIFSVLQGLFLSILKTPDNSELINASIICGLSIFVFFVFVGAALISLGVNLGFKFGFGLFLMLLILIIFELVNIFFVKSSFNVKIFAYIGLFIFSLFVIYDTNRMLQRNYYGDFITASMDYYLDILNIILDVFNLGDLSS
jgi:FtsH-binding integral membrane protein